MWDIRDMPWDWPAEVNYHEARAYCNWKGILLLFLIYVVVQQKGSLPNSLGPEYRVITEAEWHRIRDVSNAEGTTSSLLFPMRQAKNPLPTVGVEKDVVYSHIEKQANIQLAYGSSSPVNMFKPTELGFYDVHGNVWEWGEGTLML